MAKIDMAKIMPLSLLASAEEEIEVEGETAAAIERGIRAADEGRVVPSDEVRQKLLAQWNSKSSTQNQR